MARSNHNQDLNYLTQLGIKIDVYDTGFVRGRCIRYLSSERLFQVGDTDFDRWANSVDLTFDLGRKAERRALERWFAEV